MRAIAGMARSYGVHRRQPAGVGADLVRETLRGGHPAFRDTAAACASSLLNTPRCRQDFADKVRSYKVLRRAVGIRTQRLLL